MAKFSEYLKNAFWILLLIQIIPPIFKNVRKAWNDQLEPKNKVGFINLNCEIYNSASLNKHFRNFFKDPEIKAILVKIDCPGGAAGTGQAIAQEIMQLKKQYPKPIVTYSENLCASSAYHIAATTDHIVTTPAALIGNIGSKLPTLFKFKEFLQTYKIQTNSTAAGTYKNSLDPFVDMTEAQKQMLQQVVDDSYLQFANEIAQLRHLNIAQKDVWADGKIFTGKEALNLKLVDELGNQTTALNFIKKQILHSEREIELIYIEQPSILHKWLHPESDEFETECSISNSIWHSFFKYLHNHNFII